MHLMPAVRCWRSPISHKMAPPGTLHSAPRCGQFRLVFRHTPGFQAGHKSHLPASHVRQCMRDSAQKLSDGLGGLPATSDTGNTSQPSSVSSATAGVLPSEPAGITASQDDQQVSELQHRQARQVPWGWPKIVQVMLAWIMSFYILGSIVVPTAIDLLALDQMADPGPALALLYLGVDVSQLLICVTILWRSLKEYKPWASGLFQVRMGGPWVWQVMLWACSFPLVDWLSQLNQGWVPVPGMEPASFDPRDWQCNLGYIITTLLCAPVWEEIMFRGFLLLSLLRYLPPPGAVAASALIFAAFHFKLHGALPLVALGTMFAVVMLSTRNLLAPILLHSLWNLYLWAGMALRTPAPQFAFTWLTGGLGV